METLTITPRAPQILMYVKRGTRDRLRELAEVEQRTMATILDRLVTEAYAKHPELRQPLPITREATP